MTDANLAEIAAAEDDDAAAAIKRAFGCFATGVTVVSILAADGNPRGFTANSFTSVSVDPPMCLICVGDQVRSFEEFAKAENFTVSVLSAEQEDVSQIFASDDDDRFAKVRWSPAHSGAPIISGAISWFDCAVANRVEAADHLVLLGRINDFGSQPGDGLGYYRSGYRRIV